MDVRYPSSRPILLDDDGLPVPCRACASKVRGVPQLATHIADGDACCDACDPEVADTIPAPALEVEQDDDPQGCELALEASLALIDDARAAKVPVRAALRIGRDAIKRVAGRSR